MPKNKMNNEITLMEGISVIIPTYKGEKWILKCLNSLADQTLNKKLFEIIIIINGEKDNTEILVNDFKKKYSKINIKKIIIGKSGAANARNKGLKKASMQYTTFIDDDDWVSKNYLADLYSNASRSSVILGQIVDLEVDGSISKNQRALNEIIQESKHDIPSCHNLKRVIMMIPCKLVPTNLAKTIQFDTSLKSGEDIVYFTDFFISFNLNIIIVNLKKDAVYYRQLREESVSQRAMSYLFNIQERLDVIKSLNGLLKKTKDEEKTTFIQSMIDEHIGFILAYLDIHYDQYGRVLNEINKTKLKYFPYHLLFEEKIIQLHAFKEKNLELTLRLNAANAKFRDASSQITFLRNQLNQSNMQLQLTKESISYRLGHSLVHEKKKLINPVILVRKIRTLKKVILNKIHINGKSIATKTTSATYLSEQHNNKTLSDQEITVPKNDAEIYLSTLGWKEKIDKNKPIVMGVFDEFTHTCFQYQYNLIEPRPDNWRGLVEKYPPKFLFIESTWKGNYGSWQYRVAKYADSPGNELQELVAECKKRNIPTIFWNKEDPVHFDNFKHISPSFDFIFTSALESIPKYKKLTNSEVEVLQFAAEEHLHNPMKSSERKDAVCFAGSYYANRFKERREDQLMLLRAAKVYNLNIFDRNYNPDKSIRSDFEFPEEFDNCVIGSLPYAKLVNRYKTYKVFLNVNSIIDSKTMFSRRVFELLACGTPVISTEALGIEETFGKDIVWTVKNEAEATQAFETLMNDPTEWRKRSLRGIRTVFNHHMYSHRADQINNVLFEKTVHQEKKCLLICKVETEEELTRVLHLYTSQAVPNTSLSYYLVTHNKRLKIKEQSNINLVVLNDNVSKEIERIILAEEADYFSILSPTSIYGKYFMNDAIIALSYSHTPFSAKGTSRKDLYDYTKNIFMESLVCDYHNLHKSKYTLRNTIQDILNNNNNFHEEDIFCADSANFHYSNTLISKDAYMKHITMIEV